MIYHHKIGTPVEVAGDGDGMSATSPWYWYGKTQGQTVTVNNSTMHDDEGRLYFRVKLKAGTTYQIGQTGIDYQYDARIYLYNESGGYILDADDSYLQIAGVECADAFEYTPSATGIFIIGAGPYDSDVWGQYTVAIDPAPEADPVPSPGTVYPTSTGFNTWGKATGHRAASLAKCNRIIIPKQGLIFHASLASDQATAQTGQTLTKTGNVAFQKFKGIPCVKLQSGGNIQITSGLNQLPSGSQPWTISAWAASTLYDDDYGKSVFGWGNHTGKQEVKIWYSCGLEGDKYIGLNIYQSGFGTGYLYSLDNWFHVAFTYDGTIIKSYVNGVPGETKTIQLGLVQDNWFIGSLTDSYTNCFNGYIAGCRAYNRALTEDQIKKLANEFSPS